MRLLYTGLCFVLLAFSVFLAGCSRHSTAPAVPVRIVSLNLDADEIVLDLVSPERIAALSNLVDSPAVSYSVAKAAAVPARITGYTSEEIIALDPDLVIVSDWADPAFLRTLEDVGISVYRYRQAKTLAEIPAVIEGIAAAVGANERGQKLISDYEMKLSKVVNAASKISQTDRPRLCLWAYSAFSGGGDSFFHDMCRRLPVVNVLAAFTQKELGTLPQEFIIRANPDIILLTGWHMATSPDDLARRFRDDPAYRTVNAVRKNRFVPIPGRALYCYNHYAAYGLAEIITALRPELAAEVYLPTGERTIPRTDPSAS